MNPLNKKIENTYRAI